MAKYEDINLSINLNSSIDCIIIYYLLKKLKVNITGNVFSHNLLKDCYTRYGSVNLWLYYNGKVKAYEMYLTKINDNKRKQITSIKNQFPELISELIKM